MATQEQSLRDQDVLTSARCEVVTEKLSLVVDRLSSDGRTLLILPFATPPGEEVLGRRAAELIVHRLGAVPEFVAGHGMLVATGTDGRRYVPLYSPLSDEQAYSCGTIWHASTVLSGSITLRPGLRWTLTLRDVGRKAMVFEDTLIGDPEDLLDAAGDVAITMANALGMSLSPQQIERIEARETDRLDALLTYLSGSDMRIQHGITHAKPSAARSKLFEALILDPTFEAPASLLVEEILGPAGGDAVVDELIAQMEAQGAPGVAAAQKIAHRLDQAGHAGQAALLASAVLGLQPDNVEALGMAGHHAYRSGHFTRARRIVQKLLDLAPADPAAYVLQGNLLAASNRVAGAAIQWEIALGLNPEQPRVLLRLGSYLAAAGDHQRAYEALRKADALGVSTPDSLYQLGVAAYRLGLTEEAATILSRAVSISPDLPYLHIMLARCYARAGNEDMAEQHDLRAIELLPGYWPSALAVGYSALSKGRIEQALQAYTTVASARPDLPEALYGLGIALIANDMIADGLSTLIRARELDAENVPVLCALSLAYLRLGMVDDAEAAIRVAAQLAPTSEDVLHCMDKVRQVVAP